MKVWLNKKEMLECSQAATLRWQLARASGVVNQRRDGGRTDADLDLLGVKAELAVSKVFGVGHNIFQFGVDAGCDMFIGNVSVDVKSTFYPTGKLLFKSLDAFKADCAVLVTATDEVDVMSVPGFASRAVFTNGCEEADLGHGKCLVMKQELLWPLEKLWEHTQRNTLAKPEVGDGVG